MTRRSKGDEAIETAEDGEDGEGVFWVVYDFEGSRNPSKFYRNLAYVLGRYAGERIQKSVVEMRSLRGARAVEALALSYGAKVRRAKVVEG